MATVKQKMKEKPKGFKIFGKVIEKESGEGIPGLTVKAIDRDLLCEGRLGEVTTDEKGNFEIKYDKKDFREIFFDKKPGIHIVIKSPAGESIHTSENKVKYRADRTEEMIIGIPVEKLLGFLARFEVTVLRPQDMVSLHFTFYNLKHEGSSLVPIHPMSPAYMVVEFPPQNIAEEAFFETDAKFPVGDKDPDYEKAPDPFPPVPLAPVKSRISGLSRLVFRVPGDAIIPYTIADLLGKCGEYRLKVAPTALPPSAESFIADGIKLTKLAERVEILKYLELEKTGSPAVTETGPDIAVLKKRAEAWVARSGLKKYLARANDTTIEKGIADVFAEFKTLLIPPELRKPTYLETAIEAPYRLMVSPNVYAAWAHATQPVVGEGSGRVELWHTRHAVISGNKITEDEDRLRTIRAIWTRDYDIYKNKDESPYPDDHYNSTLPAPEKNPFRMSLDAFDRQNIVYLSSNYYIEDKSKKKVYKPLPVQVNRLMLTSLGAWLNVRGAWEPPDELAVEEWRHRGTMGRDHYVRVVYKGYLFPFGHRASLVKVTERKFHPQITSLLQGALYLFTQKIDTQVKDIEARSDPGIASFTKSINTNFDREITSLVESIEGKSRDEIAALVKASKDKFYNKTAALAEKVKENLRGDITGIAETAKKEFGINIDSVVKAIEGISHPAVPGNIAYLRQRMFILVREPEKLYGNCGEDKYDRQMPFNLVRITTLVTPNLDDPAQSQIDGKGQSLFWPMVGGEYFQFHLVAEDFAGNPVDFTAPLIFAEQPQAKNSADMKTAKNYYETGDEFLRKRPINGQYIMFADGGTSPGKTTFETQYLTFGAEVPDICADLKGDDIPCFYPKVAGASVIIPSIKHLAGNNQTAEISYYDDYLENGFDNGGIGEVFAEVTNSIGLDFNSQGDRSGGVVKPNMMIKGLSRIMGPVAGSNLPNIAGGTFDPEDFFAGSDAKLFGAIDLWNIIDIVESFNDSSIDVPKLTTDIDPDPLEDKLEVNLKWDTPLKDWNDLFIAHNDSGPANFNITGTMTAHASGKGETQLDISCTLTDFSIDLIGCIQSFIIIRFTKFQFISQGGKKADVNVDIAGIEFVGVLAFVETLKDIIPLKGFSDPPSLEVTSQGISAGYSLTLPTIAVGMFSLQNISLGATLTLPFISDSLSVRFNFCERESPFLLTVSLFGGGGFFAITLNPQGVQRLEAAFEFGASISVNFGVASGGVHVMAGIYFEMETSPKKAALTGYFRMGGEVDVLGIISVSIELYLGLTYEFSSGKCVGRATLTIEIEILFFSASVEISCEKKFAGSNGDPTFKELMEPYKDPFTQLDVNPWEIYCQAFA